MNAMSGKSRDQSQRRYGDAAPDKDDSQLFHRARQAFSHHVFAHSERLGRFLVAFISEITNHYEFPVHHRKFVERVVEVGCDLLPDRVEIIRVAGGLHGIGLLFASRTIFFLSSLIQHGKARGAEKPAIERGLPTNLRRFLRQNDEYGLRHLLGRVRIPELAQGRVIDHPRVTFHQRVECLLGIPGGVIVEQLPVVHSAAWFPSINRSHPGNVTRFLPFQKAEPPSRDPSAVQLMGQSRGLTRSTPGRKSNIFPHRKSPSGCGWLRQLLHFFHHQHFNRLAAGHQFEAKLIEQGLL